MRSGCRGGSRVPGGPNPAQPPLTAPLYFSCPDQEAEATPTTTVMGATRWGTGPGLPQLKGTSRLTALSAACVPNPLLFLHVNWGGKGEPVAGATEQRQGRAITDARWGFQIIAPSHLHRNLNSQPLAQTRSFQR